MLPGFLSPAMAPVVVPIIGAAVIGVRPISVTVIGRPVVTGSVVVVVITIARTVIAVRARRAGGTRDNAEVFRWFQREPGSAAENCQDGFCPPALRFSAAESRGFRFTLRNIRG